MLKPTTSSLGVVVLSTSASAALSTCVAKTPSGARPSLGCSDGAATTRVAAATTAFAMTSNAAPVFHMPCTKSTGGALAEVTANRCTDMSSSAIER